MPQKALASATPMTSLVDLRTLMLFITLVMLARAVAFWLVWRSQRHYPSMRAWAWGSTGVALGLILVGLRGPVPPQVSIVVGQACVIGGWMLIDAGFVQASGRRLYPRVWLTAYGLTMAAVAWWALVQPDYLARTFVTTLAEVGCDLYAGACAWRSRGSVMQRTAQRWLALALGMMALSNLIKLQLAWAHGGDVLLLPHWQNLQFYALATLYCVVVTALCVLLAALSIQQKLDDDIVARQAAEAQVRQLAYHDPLTHLPNRRLLEDRMQQVLAQTRRSGQWAAAMLLDLDNFKPLNDRHGHAMGDMLLQEVARRVLAQLRAADTVARLGGDEFVVVLSGLDAQEAPAREQALAVAEKIRAALAQPYVLTHHPDAAAGQALVEHTCTACIGVHVFSQGRVADIILQADQAMYQAKARGRNRVWDSSQAGAA